MGALRRWVVAVAIAGVLAACGETTAEQRLENAARARDDSGDLDRYDGDKLFAWAEQICAGTFVRTADLRISDRAAGALEEASHQELCPDKPKKGI